MASYARWSLVEKVFANGETVMIKIEFSYAKRFDGMGYQRPTVEAEWPCVPRVGEYVELAATNDIHGYVNSVSWGWSGENILTAYVTLK